MNKIDRRHFLKTTGAALATTLLLPYCTSSQKKRDPNKPLSFSGSIKGEKHSFGHQMRDKKMKLPALIPSDHIYDVVILGGGMSGLTTARRLQKDGISNVLIIEKEEQVGGLCRGGEHNGLPYACGAHYSDFPEPHMKAVNEVFEDCGIISGYDNNSWPIIDQKYLLKEDMHQLFTNGKWEPHDYPYRLANDEDEAQLGLFEQKLWELSTWTDSEGRYGLGLPLRGLSNDSSILALDKISMEEFLIKNKLTSKLLHWYCNIWIVDEFGVTIDRCSAWAGLQFFRNKIKPKGKKTPTVTFPKGLGYLSEKLAGKLPQGTIQTNHWAVQMQQQENLVLTTIWDENKQEFYQVKSKKAVFALPKHQVYHIVPELRTIGRNEFQNLHYAPWIVANIHLKHLPDYGSERIKWDNTIYDSWTMGYVNNQHQMPNPPSPDEPHIVSLYACYPNEIKTKRALMENLDWEHWAGTLLTELEKAHPTIEELITQMDIWIWGHPMRQPVVGSVWGEQRKKMNEPHGNIHFGHVDVCGIPVIEEAIDRATQIAITLKQELM